MQEFQKQKFFQEQVVVNEPVSLISKSKKGEEVLILRTADMQLITSDDMMVGHSISEAKEAYVTNDGEERLSSHDDENLNQDHHESAAHDDEQDR